MSLIDLLVRDGWLKTEAIINAFKKIKRQDFMPAAPIGSDPRLFYGREDLKNLAELNEALPIGEGQTISQPLTVAFMLELLQPKEGDKILDVGSGSGWTTALLAYIVSQKGNSKSKIRNSKQIQNSNHENSKGKVVAVEIVPELKQFGEKNVSKYNFVNPVRNKLPKATADSQVNRISNRVEKGIVEFILGDGSKGYEPEAPYDKILASASGKELPQAWKKQLKIGGRIVCPIGNSVWLFVKKSTDKFEETEYPGFTFVPLRSAESEHESA